MLRFVVLSDLHAHQKDVDDASAPSRLSSLPRHQDKSTNPIAAFPDVLSNSGFVPHLIVCPGDLGDKNDSVAQDYAWRSLENLKKRLRANRLVGVVGNHDLDSRRADVSLLPNSNLRSLSPTFPLSSKGKSAKYWSDGFVFYDYENTCLLLVNSCAFHGVATTGAAEEHLHGKISKDAIQAIRKQIRQKCKSINVLVVHHHIKQHPWIPDENSHIENGPELLEVLSQTGFQWLVIHGHAHMPNISYADNTPLSPIVFSAGSVSANLWAVPNRFPRNQAYAIDVSGVPGNGLRGRITAWDWAPYVGWSPAAMTSGLPFQSGFGLRPDLSTITTQVDALFTKRASQYLDWATVAAEVDALIYLIPEDRASAFEALRTVGITVHFDAGRNPTIFSRN
ncbi:metallophosphoesterase family protein (plasmid) [Rhizobium leguminosarum]